MEKDGTPAKTTPQRTVYRLTKQEVTQAFVAFVENAGEVVPPGERFVWMEDRPTHGARKWVATLGVDHAAIAPTAGSEESTE